MNTPAVHIVLDEPGASFPCGGIKIKGSPDWFDVQPVTVLPRNPEVGC